MILSSMILHEGTAKAKASGAVVPSWKILHEGTAKGMSKGLVPSWKIPHEGTAKGKVLLLLSSVPSWKILHEGTARRSNTRAARGVKIFHEGTASRKRANNQRTVLPALSFSKENLRFLQNVRFYLEKIGGDAATMYNNNYY